MPLFDGTHKMKSGVEALTIAPYSVYRPHVSIPLDGSGLLVCCLRVVWQLDMLASNPGVNPQAAKGYDLVL